MFQHLLVVTAVTFLAVDGINAQTTELAGTAETNQSLHRLQDALEEQGLSKPEWQIEALEKAFGSPHTQDPPPEVRGQEADPLQIYSRDSEEMEVDPIDILPPQPIPVPLPGYDMPTTRPSADFGFESFTRREPPQAFLRRREDHEDKEEVDPGDILAYRTSSRAGFGFESAPAEPIVSSPGSIDHCDIDFQMPFDMLRSIVFYLLTDDAKACSNAVREIRSLGNTFGEDARRRLQSAQFLNNPAHGLARSIVERYVDSCSYTLNEPAIAHLLGFDDRLLLLKHTGIVTTPTSRCVGTIVDGHVLTARHCFLTESVGDRHVINVSRSATKFTSLDGATTLTLEPISDVALDFFEDERDKDWIFLKIADEDHDSSSIHFLPEAAERWKPLILLSISPYVMALQNSHQVNEQMLTIDISPLCSVLARDGNYIFHSCQTLRGMSGSPLLTMHDGRVVVVGIHTGEAKQLGTACGAKLSPRYTNYGVVPAPTEGELR